jgi:hypothetical protein
LKSKRTASSDSPDGLKDSCTVRHVYQPGFQDQSCKFLADVEISKRWIVMGINFE